MKSKNSEERDLVSYYIRFEMKKGVPQKEAVAKALNKVHPEFKNNPYYKKGQK